MTKEHLLLFKNVYKEFDGVEVLTNINLYIRKNEFLTLLGPSGCGKTTMLRLLGGFEQPTAGDLLFEGKVHTELIRKNADAKSKYNSAKEETESLKAEIKLANSK